MSELHASGDPYAPTHKPEETVPAPTPVVAPATLPPGARVGRYEVVRFLARGGMGAVYVARDATLGRDVALKVIARGAGDESALRSRYQREVRAAAQLQHPNIVHVHDAGEEGDTWYYTMELVDGPSLGSVLQEGRPLLAQTALRIARDVARALAHAHERGIVHRDVKPGNILLLPEGGACGRPATGSAPALPPGYTGELRALLGDFGLARDVRAATALTLSGDILGTPLYMSPEQAGGQSVRADARSDVYSLGAVLYEMLTGVTAAHGDTVLQILDAVRTQEPVPPRQRVATLSRDVETVVLKALAKERERRYAAAADFADDLDRCLCGEAVHARRPGLAWRLRQAAHRRPVLATALAMLGLGLALAGVLLALAPRWFDRSVRALDAAGEERHGAHDCAAAIPIFQLALRGARPDERPFLLRKLVRCGGEARDTGCLLAAALELLKLDPNAAFGAHDDMVTRALVDSWRAPGQVTAGSELDRAQGNPLLAVALRRLEQLVQAARGSELERVRDATDLALVRDFFANPRGGGYWGWNSFPMCALPGGTPDELLARAHAPGAGVWERGMACYARALALEKAGAPAGAAEAYREALARLASVHPMYAGTVQGLQGQCVLRRQAATGGDRTRHFALEFEAPTGAVLRDVARGLRRVDPAAPDPLRGGLRLRIEGSRIPPEVMLAPEITLSDPSIPDYLAAWRAGQIPERWVPFELDQTAWVGVADGRYRLRLCRGAEWWLPTVTPDWNLVELDFSALPAEVEIHGATLDLPPITTRALHEIRLLTPVKDAQVDLTADAFQWTALKDVAYYTVRLVAYPVAGGGSKDVATVRVTASSLCAAELVGEPQAKVRALLPTGQRGVWFVEAFDQGDRRVGKVAELNGTFVVARGLEAH